MSKPKVLIIEDVPDSAEILRLFLLSDFDLTLCSSAAEALSSVERVAPDLLLMDIGLPEVDGVECLKRIRAMPHVANVPAIAVTAFAYPQDKERCLAAGFHAVVVKPIMDPAVLRNAIDEALRINEC